MRESKNTETRYAYVDYKWKSQPAWPIETHALVSIGDPNYDTMSENDEFDPMIWFYFRDEEEFQRAFDDYSDFEFVLLGYRESN